VTKVFFDISMSLDGYMTASGQTPDEPMGPGGDQLVAWACRPTSPRSCGGGTRMFEQLGDEHIRLERVGLTGTAAATHLRLRVVK
jgi:hypothetical protein